MNPPLPCEADPERWFADATTMEGKRLVQSAVNECRTCPALAACLEFTAKIKPHYGVWGWPLLHTGPKWPGQGVTQDRVNDAQKIGPRWAVTRVREPIYPQQLDRRILAHD